MLNQIYDPRNTNLSFEKFIEKFSFKTKLSNFLNIAINLYFICINKQYQLKLDDYYYNDKQKTYILIFRLRNKRLDIKYTIQEIYNNKIFLDSIHPVDAHIIGIIYGMYHNRIIFASLKIKYFRDYDNYYIIKPSVEITEHSIIEPSSNLILRAKSGGRQIKISILEISKNPFLLQAIGSQAATVVGLLCSNLILSSMHELDMRQHEIH